MAANEEEPNSAGGEEQQAEEITRGMTEETETPACDEPLSTVTQDASNEEGGDQEAAAGVDEEFIEHEEGDAIVNGDAEETAPEPKEEKETAEDDEEGRETAEVEEGGEEEERTEHEDKADENAEMPAEPVQTEASGDDSGQQKSGEEILGPYAKLEESDLLDQDKRPQPEEVSWEAQDSDATPAQKTGVVLKEPIIPEYNRVQLIEQYNKALVDREHILQRNIQLQTKLVDIFWRKKMDDRRDRDMDRQVTEQEQNYLKYMAQYDELDKQVQSELEKHSSVKEELKARCDQKCFQADEERSNYVEFKRCVGQNATSSQSGKLILPKDIDPYLALEDKKETEVNAMRLKHIKLKNKMKKDEKQMKSKEELGEGLHLIDFEQLKIENQAFNEKIEERNEDLLKLRRKISTTVQVLTHLKEKLQCVGGENRIQRRNLQAVEAVLAQKRDVMSHTKQARDALRIDNRALRRKCGLLVNPLLLQDFEDKITAHDALKMRLEKLKMRYSELILLTSQVQGKIKKARQK